MDHKSPFPGMDPHLEMYWGDVHLKLIAYAADQIQPLLPEDLLARADERVFVESSFHDRRQIRPDVYVAETGTVVVERPRHSSGVATAEPLVLRLADEPITQGFIQILDIHSGNRIVTLIEFLSPSNKAPGQGQALYLRKQSEACGARANLVEIDLTRSGDRSSVLPVFRVPSSHRTTYQAFVRRGNRPDEIEVYSLPLTRPLPAIRIPLREEDADVPLDLQALVDQCYRNGRYGSLDYSLDPDPPLPAEERAWAHELLCSAGKRKR